MRTYDNLIVLVKEKKFRGNILNRKMDGNGLEIFELFVKNKEDDKPEKTQKSEEESHPALYEFKGSFKKSIGGT